MLGHEIVIKVTEISKGSVKIGIEAPKEMVILRGELHDQIKAANQEAVKSLDDSSLQILSSKLRK